MAKEIKAKEKKESDILREIGEELEKKGIFFWRANNIPVFGVNNAGKKTFRSLPRFSIKGVPDLICVIRGKFVGIEVKRPGEKLSTEQVEFGNKVMRNKGMYFMMNTPDDVKDMIKCISEI